MQLAALGAIVVVVIAAGTLTSGGSDGDSAPPSAVYSAQPSAVPLARTTPAPHSAPDVAATPRAEASCVRAASVDGAGRATSYEPARAVDGDPTTAWRCDGDGVGQSLTIAYSAPVTISRIGVIPGLAKIDPVDGTDRYGQNRRISAVRVSAGFDDVVLKLETSPLRRKLQWFLLDKAITTQELTITILSSVPGTGKGGQSAYDTVAISELSAN